MNQNNKQVLALVGMAGAGKSSAVEFFVSKYQLPLIYFGGITFEELKTRGWEESQQNEKKVREELREQHGMAAFAKLSLPKIQAGLEKSHTVLVDGLYSWAEYTLLREELSCPLYLISVIASRETRYRRLSQRPTRALSPGEAEKRDFAEIEKLDKGGPIALCDYYIINEDTKAELLKEVTRVADALNIR